MIRRVRAGEIGTTAIVLLTLGLSGCGSDGGKSVAEDFSDGGADVGVDTGSVPDASGIGDGASDSALDGSQDSALDGSQDSALDGSGQDADSGTSVASVHVPVSEALLFYMGHRIPAKSDAELWRPYLSYVDKDNKVLDSYLYDSFVFLDIERIREEHPTKSSWSFFLDQLFEDGAVAPPASRVAVDVPVSGALLSKSYPNITQSNISISGGQHVFQAWTRSTAPKDNREALVAFTFRDSSGNEVTSGVTGLTWSTYIGNKWYKYLPSPKQWQRTRVVFTVPSQVVSADVTIQRFTCPDGDVLVDRAQLDAGSTPKSFASWSSAGFKSLLANGDFRTTGSWSSLHRGNGMEHVVQLDKASPVATQEAVAVKGSTTYTLAVKLKAAVDSSGHEGILGIRLFDSSGHELTSGVSNMTYSTAVMPHMFYRYADTSTSWTQRSVTFTTPANAVKAKVYLVNWEKKTTLSFDEVQLVEGSQALSTAALAAKGYETLVHDGSAEIETKQVWSQAKPSVMPSGRAVIRSLDDAAMASGDSRRRNVIIGIPIGVGFPTQTHFGQVNGKNLDLTKSSDQLAAITWYVNEALSRWQSLAPKALDLKGFYWMHESRSSDADLAGKVHSLVESKGLWLTASPYRRYLNSTQCFGSSFDATMASKFDRVWQQPNVWPGHHWNMTQASWNTIHDCLCKPNGVALTYDEWMQYGYPPCELKRVDDFIDVFEQQCKQLNPSCAIHVNIEWVPGLESEMGYGRVLDYINVDQHLTHDFMRFQDRMWYEAAGFGWKCALSSDPAYRDEYEKVYQFIQRTHSDHGFPAPSKN